MFAKCIHSAWLLCFCLFFGALSAAPAHAVNFAAGVKLEQAYQLKLFPFYYCADTRTNKDGNPAVTDLGMQKYGVMISNGYQIGDVLLSALVPLARLEITRQK
ncbi:MAG: hypothetical protein J0653_04145, partial [Deltaproteobacteria bacterium]|nr:hypothetical protein [Deltaproteobacteria bacterium]